MAFDSIYLKPMFDGVLPPSGEVTRTAFGAEHQKPPLLLPVFVGLMKPALLTALSIAHAPKASTTAVPITMLFAAVNVVQTPATL